MIARTPPAPTVLAEVTRGRRVESRHFGHVAAAAPDGAAVFAAGDPAHVVYLRSAVKPLQAVALVASGAAERFGLTDAEVALVAGSHNGEDAHAEACRSILRKIGLGPGAFRFGRRPPLDPETADGLRRRGEAPARTRHECSGEHAGLLALAVHLGAPPASYADPGGAVEQTGRACVARFAGLDPDRIETAPDNCGVVTYAVPLHAVALAYARLAAPPADWDAATRAACGRVVRAMTAHPEFVAGTDPDVSLDTVLMQRGRGRFVSKEGAEGLYAAGGHPARAHPAGPGAVGLAVAVEDGDAGERARGPVAAALLRRLGLLGDADVAALGGVAEGPVRGDRGERVGVVRAAVRPA